MTNLYDILIIDDNIDDFETCDRILSRQKNLDDEQVFRFQARHAKNAQNGFDEIDRKKPDCILLDYSLPGYDGLSVLKEIKKRYSNLPVVFFTGQGSENLAVSLLKAGASDYIIKSDIHKQNLTDIFIKAIQTNSSGHTELDIKDTAFIKVMIVDDNEDDRELVRRTLNKADKQRYRFFEFPTGENIINEIETVEPDCVLLDYSLPGENGLVVLGHISDRFPYMPVIVFSGQGSEHIAAEAIKNGAFHYLIKGELTPDLLDTTVKQGIDKNRLEKIVKQKNREIKLHQHTSIEQKKRYDRVIKATNTAVWEYYFDEDLFYIEDQIFSLIGESFEKSQLTLKRWRDLAHPDDRERIEQYWQEYTRGADSQREITYRIHHASGEWRWYREAGNVVSFNKHGKPGQIAGLIEDVTEKRNEDEVLNKLYTLATDEHLSIDKKVSEVLRLGLVYFNLELGLVSHISNQEYEVKYCEPDDFIERENTFLLADTYCSHVYGYRKVKCWTEAGNSEIQTHPCYLNQKLETYIGTTIFVNQKPYGTLAFVKKEARGRPFSDREKTLMSLMAQWISSEFTRQSNLQQIEESQDFLLLIQDSIPDLIFVKDDSFRIVRANPAFLNVYPESVRDSVIGTTTLEKYDQEEAELFLRQDKLALKNGSSETEEVIQFPDGVVRTLHTKKIRFSDKENNKYILGIGRDITERKKADALLAESEERYELAVRGSSVGLWDWNVETGELFWSDRFKKIVGISDADFRPHYDEFVSRVHPDDKEKVEDALFSHIENKTPYNVEYRLRRTDDTYVWIHARGQAIWNDEGKATRMAGSVDDISTSKAAQEELLRSNMELERFAYLASHDLQEPLRMVTNFTELLEKKYGDQLDERAKQYISFASGGASRMQLLVRGLLEYARIGNEAESFKEVDLNELKSSIEENLLASIQQTRAVIEWSDLPTILADPPQIRSVFQNLIGNAIKYQKPSVEPRITVDVDSCKEEWVFSVSDNGIGMKQEYCEKIFEPFRRLHRKEEYAGTGMGLSICRKTIEVLGGSIWATSELEKGSTFYFKLPKLKSNQE